MTTYDLDYFKTCGLNSKVDLTGICDDSYVKNYPSLVEFFKNATTIPGSGPITSVTLLGLAHVAYGWMPTAIRTRDDYSGIAVKILEKVVRNRRIHCIVGINYEELTNLNSFFAGDMVGMSKLLHFTDPAFYPIMDAHTCRALGITDKYIGMGARLYMNYVEIIQVIRNRMLKEHPIIFTEVGKIFGYTPTATRVIEYLLYRQGKYDFQFIETNKA